MKTSNLLILILILIFNSCALFKRDVDIDEKLEPIMYQPVDYLINPGEVIKISFQEDVLIKDPYFSCKNNEIPSHVEGDKRVAYLAETYFSKKKGFQCQFGERNGKLSTVANIKIGHVKYPSERLYVDKRRVSLNKKDLKRVRSEQKHLNKIYKSSPSKPFFSHGFAIPLKSKITSYYGSKRVFNNKKQTQHLGTDFRAAIGVPIRVSNSGKVVLARDLFYTGKTVIVDHGLGIFTVYGHLSKLKTIEGEYVPQNSLIGLSGMTGRVTGPHLHWGVKVNGHYINGKSLVKATFGQE